MVVGSIGGHEDRYFTGRVEKDGDVRETDKICAEGVRVGREKHFRSVENESSQEGRQMGREGKGRSGVGRRNSERRRNTGIG